MFGLLEMPDQPLTINDIIAHFIVSDKGLVKIFSVLSAKKDRA